jgi:hypothetical protein
MVIIIGQINREKDSENLLGYSKLNVARMNRLNKPIEIIPGLKELLEQIDTPQTWLVLTVNYPKSISVLSPMFKLRLKPFTLASLPISELSSTTSNKFVYEPIMLSRTTE